MWVGARRVQREPTGPFEANTRALESLYRLPITFIEMFPVGVVISLISAALLRNSCFLPARAQNWGMRR